jgi:hypothetical protein
MLPRLKLAALALGVVTLPLAGCNNSKRTNAVEAGTTTLTVPPPTRTYHSRPDLKPPLVRIGTVAHRTGPGYVFIAPTMVVAQAGPMIMDNRGEVIWFKPLNTRGVTDFRVQNYRGKPVLTWWHGHVSNVGVGDGWYVIYDTSYRPVAEVRPGNGLVGDLHEFLITKSNTALFTVYHRLPVDLSSVGAQLLPNGNILVGWGAQPHVSEFARSGALLFDVYFGQGKPPGKDTDSYRAYRFPWHGHPRDRPVVVVAGQYRLLELERRHRCGCGGGCSPAPRPVGSSRYRPSRRTASRRPSASRSLRPSTQ